MVSIKLLNIIVLSVILLAEILPTTASRLGFSQPVMAQASKRTLRVVFQPRSDQKTPQRTVGGGRRNENRCSVAGTSPPLSTNQSQDLSLMALLPSNSLGTTLSSHPSLLVYVPATSAQVAELTLEDENSTGLYQTTIPLPAAPGIVSFELPKTEAGLEVGKSYKWVFSLICNPSGPQNPFIEAWVQRVKPGTTLSQRLSSTKGLDQVMLYASSGIWHEALSVLATLRRNQPEAPELVSAWQELLQSAGLGAGVTTAPLQK